MYLSNIILSGLLTVSVALVLYFIFKEKIEDYDQEDIDRYSIPNLCDAVKKSFNEIVNLDLNMLNLNLKDLESRRAMKRSLSDAIRKCSQGNLAEKMVVFARMKNTLSGTLGITEDVINETIPFQNPDYLSSTEKFEILMYLQKRKGNRKLFQGICKATHLDELKKDNQGFYYSVTEEDLSKAYDKLSLPLSYDDKLNILTQRIYEETYGLSVVDMMIMEDNSLDSISGGISGSTKDDFRFIEDDVFTGQFNGSKTHESIWIVFEGKSIHLKFLTFKSNTEMIRICRNLSEHGRTGHFTSSEGGLKTHLADGSRATIFRPNNALQWSFFVRKFSSVSSYDLNELITDKGCENPIGVIRWGIRGCLNLFFSGDQNSGKTTNLRAAVREMDQRQPIRSIEADFELYLNDAYLNKNILGTRPSERMSFSKLIELLKSSEAHTILFGETASLEHAKYLIDLLLAGTKRIITTGHWPTTDELVSYFIHSMGAYGGSGVADVEAMLARLLHLDIHCVKDNDGHRHIDRITEVIPYSKTEIETELGEGLDGRLNAIIHCLKQMTHRKTYATRDIVIYEDGEYRMIHPFSEELSKIILRNLPPEEKLIFLAFNQVNEGSERKAC